MGSDNFCSECGQHWAVHEGDGSCVDDREADGIPAGAVRIHLYDVNNVLRPRGVSMEKESLSLAIHERLMSVFEEWTDTKYGDNSDRAELVAILKDNLDSEVRTAWEKFVRDGGESWRRKG